MMQPATFLIGTHPERGQLWVAIDANAHHLQPRVGERRFAAYLAPYPNEEAARRALIGAGAQSIEPEVRKRRGR